MTLLQHFAGTQDARYHDPVLDTGVVRDLIVW